MYTNPYLLALFLISTSNFFHDCDGSTAACTGRQFLLHFFLTRLALSLHLLNMQFIVFQGIVCRKRQ